MIAMSLVIIFKSLRTVGSNSKFPTKMRFKKFVKMTDHTCSCNDLTNFWYETRNDRKRKLFEYAGIWMEKLVKSLWVNLFLAGFSHLEPLCDATTKSSSWSEFFLHCNSFIISFYYSLDRQKCHIWLHLYVAVFEGLFVASWLCQILW